MHYYLYPRINFLFEVFVDNLSFVFKCTAHCYIFVKFLLYNRLNLKFSFNFANVIREDGL